MQFFLAVKKAYYIPNRHFIRPYIDKWAIFGYIYYNKMEIAKYKLTFLVLVLSILFIDNPPAFSQPPGIERATRETDRLGREAQKREDSLVGEPKPLPRPKPIEPPVDVGGQKFFVRKVIIQGCESFIPEDFAGFTQKYEGREVTFGELDALARQIGREYLNRGIIAAVFLPPQDVVDDTVTIQVVEARMGDLEILPHSYFKNKRLNKYWKTGPGEILHYDKISRNIQMMNKNPDRETKAALRAGKLPGTTDIILTTEAKFPMHGSFAFDKEGQVQTGKSRKTFGWRHNNFLGLDDTFLTGYTWGRNFLGNYYYHSMPITQSGTTLVYGYSYSISKPKKDFAEFGIDSKAENKSVVFHQDLFRRDQYAGEMYLGIDAKDKWVKTNKGLLNRDKLRSFRLGGNFVKKRQDSSTTFSFEYLQSVRAFAASSRHDPLLSRNADSVYTKFTGGMRNKTLLPLKMQENLKIEGQYTLAKLTPQEEYSLGGLDSVRGYPPSDYLADIAVLTNLEILFPASFIPSDWKFPYATKSFKDQVTGVVFVDYGYGERRAESKSHNLVGPGLGFRISLYDQVMLRFEWGFPAGDRPITEGSKTGRFHFSIDIQENFPEEIQRIRLAIQEENLKKAAWHLVDMELARPDSSLRQRLFEDLYLAERYYRQGKLKEAKKLYEKIDRVSKSLYNQAEEYVRECAAKEKELKERKLLAASAHKEGRLKEAREMWQKISDDARFKPLLLRF